MSSAVAGGGEKTFSRQDSLPPLPVPSLRHTLDRYLDSVRPLVPPAQFDRTEALVDQFARKEAIVLQRALQSRAESHRNWLSELWERYAYLRLRAPIHPLVNIGGPSPDMPAGVGQLTRAAVQMHLAACYWRLLRLELVEPTKSRGTPWCMQQAHYLFNACRIPRLKEDTLRRHFRTVSEGDCASHAVVVHRRRLFKVPLAARNSPDAVDIYSPAHFYAVLRDIVRHRDDARVAACSVDLGTLMCDERDAWAMNYDALLRADGDGLTRWNKSTLRDVETSVFVLMLTDHSPCNQEELLRFAIMGEPSCHMPDKSMVLLVHANGFGGQNSDHSNLDAIVVTQMNDWGVQVAKHKGYELQGYDGPIGEAGKQHYERLHLCHPSGDVAMAKAAADARRQCMQYIDDAIINRLEFDDYGNDFFRAHKVYGDTVVQMATQAAYVAMHGRPAPVYETASTRQYYHGRTETVRSCTTEAVRLARLLADRSAAGGRELQAAFDRAVATHDRLMGEASGAHGCDRHLLGLRAMAEQMRMADPEIFSDPSWLASGGDGNFTISTSFIGYSSQYGGTVAMTKDGYGVFYKINKDRIVFTLATWKSSGVTDMDAFTRHLQRALRAVRPLVVQRHEATVKAKAML